MWWSSSAVLRPRMNLMSTDQKVNVTVTMTARRKKLSAQRFV